MNYKPSKIEVGQRWHWKNVADYVVEIEEVSPLNDELKTFNTGLKLRVLSVKTGSYPIGCFLYNYKNNLLNLVGWKYLPNQNKEKI